MFEVFGAQLENQLDGNWSTCTDEATNHFSPLTRILFWIPLGVYVNILDTRTLFTVIVTAKSYGPCFFVCLFVFLLKSKLTPVTSFLFTTRLICTEEMMKKIKELWTRAPPVFVCFFTFCVQQGFYGPSPLSRDLFLEDYFCLKPLNWFQNLQICNTWIIDVPSMHEPDMRDRRQMFLRRLTMQSHVF